MKMLERGVAGEPRDAEGREEAAESRKEAGAAAR